MSISDVMVRGEERREAQGELPTKFFCLNLLANLFLVRKFLSKNAKFGAKIFILEK